MPAARRPARSLTAAGRPRAVARAGPGRRTAAGRRGCRGSSAADPGLDRHRCARRVRARWRGRRDPPARSSRRPSRRAVTTHRPRSCGAAAALVTRPRRSSGFLHGTPRGRLLAGAAVRRPLADARRDRWLARLPPLLSPRAPRRPPRLPARRLAGAGRMTVAPMSTELALLIDVGSAWAKAGVIGRAARPMAARRPRRPAHLLGGARSCGGTLVDAARGRR